MEKELQNKIFDAFQKDRKDAEDLRNEMNSDFHVTRSKIVEQKREFYKHITILSGVILGLSSFINVELLKSSYYLIGLTLHLFVIGYVLLHMREFLDKESTDLQSDQDQLNIIIEQKLTLVDKYSNQENYSVNTINEYFKEIRTMPGSRELKEANQKLSEARKNRHKELMDYSAELVNFLFIVGTMLIAFSIVQYVPSPSLLTLLILLLFYTTFNDSVLTLMYPLFKLATFLKSPIGKRGQENADE